MSGHNVIWRTLCHNLYAGASKERIYFLYNCL